MRVGVDVAVENSDFDTQNQIWVSVVGVKPTPNPTYMQWEFSFGPDIGEVGLMLISCLVWRSNAH